MDFGDWADKQLEMEDRLDRLERANKSLTMELNLMQMFINAIHQGSMFQLWKRQRERKEEG